MLAFAREERRPRKKIAGEDARRFSSQRIVNVSGEADKLRHGLKHGWVGCLYYAGGMWNEAICSEYFLGAG